MKKRFTVIIIVALALICLLFAACPTEFELPPSGADNPWGHMVMNTVSGEEEFVPYTGPRRGSVFGYASMVEVSFTLNNGTITNLTIDSRGESQNHAPVRSVPTALPPMIRRANSFDIPPNAISGATITVVAVIAAGNQALQGLVMFTEND